jgi:hypothetical protein
MKKEFYQLLTDYYFYYIIYIIIEINSFRGRFSENIQYRG